ncbi:MAG TPA: 4-hydroxythreonine-4-phosphate dehydrogenase PdxA [Gemmatimonadaceae bacterium]|nr:4-hydroxythreonine-4-phosphate dehydrogenase PdxA [Gemmatimonadaceae bacterium]
MSIRLAVTAGDPRGIGPEIISKALADPRIGERSDLLVIGPRGCGVDVDESVGEWKQNGDIALAGRLSGLAITRAVELALNGDVDGIVTAPIDKAALFAGGYDYPGHTEMLAALTHSDVAMMLAATRPRADAENPLRVVLATTHIALRDVPAQLTAEKIISAATITREYLTRWFGIASPRIALCALNPHAGDGGRFGEDDSTLLAPAARSANIDGPFPADTVFVRAMKGEFDAVIAPYHDVGMTAIKVAAFGSAVNVTLGLPFPRTSPDHGTALDIAGRGIADPSSLVEALLLCQKIASSDPPSGGRRRNGGRQQEYRSSAHPSREQ